MNTEQIRDIAQIVICLAILAFCGYIQVTTGEIPAPWDSLLFAAVAVVGIGDGLRLVVKRRNNQHPTRNTKKEQ